MKNQAQLKNTHSPAQSTIQASKTSFAKSLALTVAVIAFLGLTNAERAQAQSDRKVTSAEQSFEAKLSARLEKTAKPAGVALSPNLFAYAATPGALAASSPVPGSGQLNADGLVVVNGNVLLVYIGANNLQVPPGYYVVNLIGEQAAQFTSAATGAVVATLPATVTRGGQPGGAGVVDTVSVSITLSIMIDHNGNYEFDIKIEIGTAFAVVTIPVPLKVT
ncbi:MAG: hypothetical protein ACREDR_21010 [Blastocatellia bacterium]